jgi:hypothetical protein
MVRTAKPNTSVLAEVHKLYSRLTIKGGTGSLLSAAEMYARHTAEIQRIDTCGVQLKLSEK